MRAKLWLVALYELRVNVTKKSFILALLSVPLFIAFSLGVGLLIVASRNDDRPLGYIDRSGVLAYGYQAPLGQSKKRVEMVPMRDEAGARQALEDGKIQAYFVLPPKYFDEGKVELYYRREPGENAIAQLYDFLQANLLRAQPSLVARRATLGSKLIGRSLSDNLEFDTAGPSLAHLAPLLLSLAFVGLLVLSSGYLMEAIFREKQNRTIEVLFTSLAPRQLIWGKVLGVVAIGFSLLAAWILIGVLAVFIGGEIFDIAWLQNPTLDWRRIGVVTAVAIPSYVMTMGIMFSAGALVANPEDSERIGPLFFFAYFLPFYFIQPLLENPHEATTLVMSMLPFTSLVTMGFRAMFTLVPLWQVAASLAIQLLAAAGALWLATKTFRLGMLRFGKTLRISEALRSRRPKTIWEAP